MVRPADRRDPPEPRRRWATQRGGDTSDTMYRFLSLYRCIAMYRMYLMYRAEKRCQHARSELYRCIAMYRCIDTAIHQENRYSYRLSEA